MLFYLCIYKYIHLQSKIKLKRKKELYLRKSQRMEKKTFAMQCYKKKKKMCFDVSPHTVQKGKYLN